MKCIIFDLDNTLIDWIDEYNLTIKKALECFTSNVSKELVDLVNTAINAYDKNENIFSKEGLLLYINKYCNLDLPIDFINKIEEYQKECAHYDKELVDTIEYLNTKYDLYLVSNWFTETQIGRLKKAGIYKYFKDVFGADKYYFKPDKRAFSTIANKYGVENCISVGDSLENDIIPAQELGMNAIWKTNRFESKYPTIKSIYELRSIL